MKAPPVFGLINALCILLLPVTSEAQGRAFYLFSNINVPANINAPVFDASGNALSGSNYMALLYAGLTPTSLTPTILAGSATKIGSSGISSLGYIVGVNVWSPNVPGKTESWVQVKVWDSTLGGTYEEVVGRQLGGYGESKIFSVVAGFEESILRPAPLVGLESFSVRATVPEPSPLVLLLLGGCGLGLRAYNRRHSHPHS